MREFVYLDEVSVYSLIVSRLGPVAAEFTETESNSLRSEITTSAGATAGVVKSDARAGTETTRTGTSQVVRRAMIQSTFKDLLECEHHRLELSTDGRTGSPPSLAGAGELAAASKALLADGWLFRADELRRGQLVELDVELEAESVYKLITAFSTMLDFVVEHPEFLAEGDRDSIGQAEVARSVFESMLVGLVPVRGRVVDYQYLSVGGERWVVHSRLVAALPTELAAAAEPLYVVGVAETSSFWKDIRRVLFSRSRYTMMCRLGRDGVNDTWTPAKLLDVLNEFLPAVASDLHDIIEHGMDGLWEADSTPDDLFAMQFREALLAYAADLADSYGRISDTDALVNLGLIDLEKCRAATSVELRVEMFSALVRHLEEQAGVAIDPRAAAQKREAALRAAGLGPNGAASQLDVARSTKPTEPSSERLLDAEIVAIYW